MKKLLSAALAAVLTLSLAACSNAPETKEYTTEELSQILSSAISENSDGMAEVITTEFAECRHRLGSSGQQGHERGRGQHLHGGVQCSAL